ncbi:MAG: exodeoxyribonuclease VII small subunit [Bacilli bacterium]|nr:exodeoxyribonuclease VII small subunit [Bacilli bacterium]
MKFEQLLEELNQIVKDLESGALSLEDSLAKYQRGMELSLLCKKQLQDAKEIVLQKMNPQQEVK